MPFGYISVYEMCKRKKKPNGISQNSEIKIPGFMVLGFFNPGIILDISGLGYPLIFG